MARFGMLEILSGLGGTDKRDIIEIRNFCVKYDIILTSVNYTHESGKKEPMYFFSDELGGYTIDAIRNSLE